MLSLKLVESTEFISEFISMEAAVGNILNFFPVAKSGLTRLKFDILVSALGCPK